jgi:C-terminal processing protease CtpA/Prc
MFAELTKSHQLKAGDIVFSVNGMEKDDIANTPELYIKLHNNPGDSVNLGVIRDGRRIQMNLKTYRVSFRK